MVSGVRSSWLASATNARSRRAGMGHPREHRVQGLAQPADLVARLGQRQAGVGIGGGDRRRPAAHRLDGPQRAGGQRVAGERRERQRERPADQQRAREDVERVLALGQVGADHDHAPGGADRLGEHAQALATVAHDPPALRVAQLAGAEQRRGAPTASRPRSGPGVDDLDDVADLPGGQAGVRSRAAGSPLRATAATSWARSASASSMPWSIPALVCRNRKTHTMASTKAMTPV